MCGYGGIGRRARFRLQWVPPCRFKSCYPHQNRFSPKRRESIFIWNTIGRSFMVLRKQNCANTNRHKIKLQERKLVFVLLSRTIKGSTSFQDRGAFLLFGVVRTPAFSSSCYPLLNTLHKPKPCFRLVITHHKRQYLFLGQGCFSFILKRLRVSFPVTLISISSNPS